MKFICCALGMFSQVQRSKVVFSHLVFCFEFGNFCNIFARLILVLRFGRLLIGSAKETKKKNKEKLVPSTIDKVFFLY